MDYIFEIGKPFCGINFDFDEAQLKALLGEPSERELDHSPEDESIKDITLEYDAHGLSVVLNYIEEDLVGLDIFTDKIIIDDVDLYSLTETQMLEVLQELSAMDEEEAYVDHTELEAGKLEVMYAFSDIGLTVWCVDKQVTDVCISEIMDEDDEF